MRLKADGKLRQEKVLHLTTKQNRMGNSLQHDVHSKRAFFFADSTDSNKICMVSHTCDGSGSRAEREGEKDDSE